MDDGQLTRAQLPARLAVPNELVRCAPLGLLVESVLQRRSQRRARAMVLLAVAT